jgi:hypothetical protein
LKVAPLINMPSTLLAYSSEKHNTPVALQTMLLFPLETVTFISIRKSMTRLSILSSMNALKPPMALPVNAIRHQIGLFFHSCSKVLRFTSLLKVIWSIFPMGTAHTDSAISKMKKKRWS